MKLVLNLIIILCFQRAWSAEILMITMGGTKSHKIPFWELAKGLIKRNHNITFVNGFPADFSLEGLHEITPLGLVEYISNFTNWDLLGARMHGKMPVSIWDAMRYPSESCSAMLNDAETKELLYRNFDLVILDGAFPECALGLVYKLKIPFMYINTVGFYTGSMSQAGNPNPYSVIPIFLGQFTDKMNILQRAMNTAMYIISTTLHMIMVSTLDNVLRQHFGNELPSVYDISKNVSFILQNGHSSITYPRPLLPNIAEIACIHCRPAKLLPFDLENFINGSGDYGFIYVSMGSSVKASNMPEHLRWLFIQTFARLPYRIIWKWEGNPNNLKNLSPNVKLSRWLPQQDILGHRKLRAFITHGGLLSMFESVYHGVPIITMPVFCDHDANAAKAEIDGYALKINLETLTMEKLYRAILKIVHDPRYRQAAKQRQKYLHDQIVTPMEKAVFWTEYVLRHKGAYHLQTPARHMSWIQYYLFDVIALYTAAALIFIYILRGLIRNDFIIKFRRKYKIN